MAKEMFTDNKRVRDLIKLMADNDLTEIELVEDKSTIRLKRDPTPVAAVPMAVSAVASAPVHAVAPAAAPAAAAPVSAKPPVAGEAIKSPMVGTFYAAAGPDSPPFVKVGSHVDKDTVVCIIEAMKVFNEIKAETTGTIAKVLVQNGQGVEFNQPLFLLKAD
ncbi:MAG: acetyl-CoA carboxylase biotin carboxyl carrier protein [Phycisphaerae bacterium]